MNKRYSSLDCLPRLTIALALLLVLSCESGVAQPLLTDSLLASERNAFRFSGLPFCNAEHLEWRFAVGDDLQRAEADFPDETWLIASPSTVTDADSLSQQFLRAKIVWFRQHFRVDSTLDRRSFGFVISLAGAAEVYLDGRMIGKYGVPSANSAQEILPSISRFTLQSMLLHLETNKPHVIAIRYSFAHHEEYSKKYQGELTKTFTGLRTAYMRWSAVEEYRQTALQTVIQFGVAVGMPLLAGVLHIVLFVLYRRERANLFVGIFSLASSLQACSFALSSHVMGQSYDAFVIGGLLQMIAMPCIGLSLWYVAITLFGAALPKYHLWIVRGNIILWGGAIVAGYLPSGMQLVMEILAICTAFVPLVLTLPIVVSAMRRNADGAYILGLGMVVCVAAWTLEILMLLMGLFYAARPLAIAIFIRFGVYIAIPLALSVLLARRTARQAQSLAEQNELLEEKVAKRTQALFTANEVLQRQNKQLVEVNSEKNEIVSIVSHDLKNPITALRGLAELMQTDHLEPQQSAIVAEQIVRTSDRMLDLVKNLLDVNRLESGLMQFGHYDFAIVPLVEGILRQYHSAAAAKNITLHCEYPDKALTVLADEQAVMQVVDNLLSNAVKYSPRGKNVFVRVKAETKQAEPEHSSFKLHPSSFIRVEVQDEGEGVSAADMKKLFGKFARLSAQPTGGENSTGLGLSIVKKMVEAMSGRVWCESEFGKGATFIVELPAGGGKK